MASTYYMRQVTPPGEVNPPAAWLGGWTTKTGSDYGSTNGFSFIPIAGLTQIASGSIAYGSTGTTEALAQFIMPMIQGVSISGNWTVAFALSCASANAYTPYVAIALVNGSTGAVRNWITNAGSSTPVTCGGARTPSAGAEYTCYNASVTGASVTATTGDYIVVEVGVS
jgi:hypothetical protein